MPNVKTSKKSDIDPNFQKQVDNMKDKAREDHEMRKRGEQVKWLVPQGWDGDPWNWESMKDPFKREKANADYIKACSDQMNPGRTGDLIITTSQIGMLATMERAFRARHSFHFPRPLAHQTCRRKGHGDEKGIFKVSMLDYINQVIKQTAEKGD